MRGSSALLVSLLLLVTGAVAPVSVGADDAAQTNPMIVSMNHTANYLTVPDQQVTRSDTTRDGLALSTAIDGDTASIRSEFIKVSFQQSFEEATTDGEKAAAIRAAADRVERRNERLQRRNAAAIQAYANGSISAGEFSRERARIHRTAGELRAAIRRVDAVARTDDSYSPSASLRIRLANIAGELEVLQGSVSGQVSQASSGVSASQNIYVEASNDGYTMAYVTEDTYVRETYLGSERTSNVTDTFEEASVPRGNAARLRGYELYSWVANHSLSPAIQGLGRSGIYRFTADFTDGELTAYIDGGTTNVFRESQRHKLSAMRVSNTITATNGTLDVRVNKTYETGPLKVELMRNGTGVPTDGTVLVDGESVGQTGDDGTLWIVEPTGPDRIRVVAEENESVSVFLPG